MRHSKPHMLKRRFGLSLLYTDTKLFSHWTVVTERGSRFLMSQNTARPLWERSAGLVEWALPPPPPEGNGPAAIAPATCSQVDVVLHEAHASVAGPALLVIIAHNVLVVWVRVLGEVALDQVPCLIRGEPAEQQPGGFSPAHALLRGDGAGAQDRTTTTTLSGRSPGCPNRKRCPAQCGGTSSLFPTCLMAKGAQRIGESKQTEHSPNGSWSPLPLAPARTQLPPNKGHPAANCTHPWTMPCQGLNPSTAITLLSHQVSRLTSPPIPPSGT